MDREVSEVRAATPLTPRSRTRARREPVPVAAPLPSATPAVTRARAPGVSRLPPLAEPAHSGAHGDVPRESRGDEARRPGGLVAWCEPGERVAHSVPRSWARPRPVHPDAMRTARPSPTHLRTYERVDGLDRQRLRRLTAPPMPARALRATAATDRIGRRAGRECCSRPGAPPRRCRPPSRGRSPRRRPRTRKLLGDGATWREAGSPW